jgi:hypothetical protein
MTRGETYQDSLARNRNLLKMLPKYAAGCVKIIPIADLKDSKMP